MNTGAAGTYPIGRLSSVSETHPNGDVGTTMTYDARGRVLSEVKTITVNSVPKTETTSFQYDSSDTSRVWKTTYPDNEVVVTAFDRSGQPQTLGSATAYVSSAQYDVFGRPTSIVHANGTTDTRGYYGQPGAASFPAGHRLQLVRTDNEVSPDEHGLGTNADVGDVASLLEIGEMEDLICTRRTRGGGGQHRPLTHWQIDVRDMVAVDIGASTGGFTDCLLQRGARHVFAIDVGYGQFAWKLRQDPRVTLFERANIRGFDPSRLPQRANLATIDVSFISLRLVLPIAISLLHSGGIILALVKPQFEVGKGEVGKGGVVRDPVQHQAVVETVREFGVRIGLECRGEYVSPILGPKGNREFFLDLRVCSPP